MAPEAGWCGLSEGEIAGLTDLGLVERHAALRAASVRFGEEYGQAEADLLARMTTEALDRVRFARQDGSRRDAEFWRLRAEMGRRLGSLIRSARLAAGLTVRQVAECAGVRPGAISHVERGRYWGLHHRTVALFAQVFIRGGIDPDDPDSGDWRYAPLVNREACRPLRAWAATVDPSWLAWHDGVIPDLARQVHRGRAFGLLPILGDALEEAGCDAADVLSHCRHPGEHVRACCVAGALLMVDLGRRRGP